MKSLFSGWGVGWLRQRMVERKLREEFQKAKPKTIPLELQIGEFALLLDA